MRRHHHHQIGVRHGLLKVQSLVKTVLKQVSKPAILPTVFIINFWKQETQPVRQTSGTTQSFSQRERERGGGRNRFYKAENEVVPFSPKCGLKQIRD